MAISLFVLGGAQSASAASLSFKPGAVPAGDLLILGLLSSIQGTADNSPSDTAGNFIQASAGFIGSSFGDAGPNMMLFLQPQSLRLRAADMTSIAAPAGQTFHAAAAEFDVSGLVSGAQKSGVSAQNVTAAPSLRFDVIAGDFCFATVGIQGQDTDIFTADPAWTSLGAGVSSGGLQLHGAWTVAPQSGTISWRPGISIARNWLAVGFTAAP